MQGYTPPPPGGYGAPQNPQNPYAGYSPPMMTEPLECALAKQALTYALVGLFCFGVVLGPMAISKARSAKMIIAGNPGMRGEGMATAALIIGILDVAFFFVGIAIRFALLQ
jgi:hypothetical protein